MYECDVWNFPRLFSRARFQRNWLERQEFYNAALSRHRLVLGRSLRGLENVRSPEELYRVFAQGKGAPLWGEKSPHYCQRLSQLAKDYPHASFIFLWRDSSEIYRSVIRAGWNDRFFRQRGILSRIIFDMEQMIRAAAQFSRAGVRVHHVTYNGLTDDTEQTCRGLCRFLQIDFDKNMLDLERADLSAVYHGQHHEPLRNRVVERRRFSSEVADQSTLIKLQRFHARWNRLTQPWVGEGPATQPAGEPSSLDCVVHTAIGFLLHLLEGVKRLLFEFFPLPWFRAYRSFKQKMLSSKVERPRLPITKQFAAYGSTIFLSYMVLAVVGTADFLTGANVTLAPFYAIPVAILTLVINLRWGKWAALIAAVTWSVLQNPHYLAGSKLGFVIWNSVMRFLLLLAVAFPLDRLLAEKNSPGENN